MPIELPSMFQKYKGLNYNKTTSYGSLLALRFAGVTSLNALRAAYGEPAVIIGGLPFYRVKHIEVARSEKTLEFRAIGAAFLGQQKGGNLGIRIDLELNTREMIQFNYLWMLLEISRGKKEKYDVKFKHDEPSPPAGERQDPKKQTFLQDTMDVYDFSSDNIPRLIDQKDFFYGGKSAYFAAIEAGSMPDPNFSAQSAYKQEFLMVNQMGKDFYNKFTRGTQNAGNSNTELYSPNEDDWKYTVTHRTFPLVLPNEIIFDCFIESVMFKRDVRSGKDNVVVSVLLRQYQPDRYPVEEKHVVLSNSPFIDRLRANTNKNLQYKPSLMTEVTYRDTVDKPTGTFPPKNNKTPKVLPHYMVSADSSGKKKYILLNEPEILAEIKNSSILSGLNKFINPKLTEKIQKSNFLNMGVASIDLMANGLYRIESSLFFKNRADQYLRTRQIRNMGVLSFINGIYKNKYSPLRDITTFLSKPNFK